MFVRGRKCNGGGEQRDRELGYSRRRDRSEGMLVAATYNLLLWIWQRHGCGTFSVLPEVAAPEYGLHLPGERREG